MSIAGYRFKIPEVPDAKVFTDIVFTDKIRAQVHIYRGEGGEGFLHDHEGEDVVWYVMGGSVRFHDDEDRAVDIQVGESIVITENTKYWFEKASVDPLLVVRVGAKDPDVETWNTRRLYGELPPDFKHATRDKVELRPLQFL